MHTFYVKSLSLCLDSPVLLFKNNANFIPMNKDLILRERLALQRTKLANQSTFLSFLRTSMYFLVAGISINSLIKIKEGLLIEISFISVSAGLLIIGVVNFYLHKRKITDSEKHIGDYKMEFLEE